MSTTPDPPGMPRPWVRAVVSVLLALHVFAVFVGPWSLLPDSSYLAITFRGLFEPYLQATYLQNGYRFFAPDPGPSHLVRYELVLDDGRRVEGVFPNLREERPRLLYHRHFMLSEFLNMLSNPNAPPEEAARAEAYAFSYAQHLAHERHAREVKLVLMEHLIPFPDDVAAGRRLTDPKLFEDKRVFGPYRFDGS